MIKINLLKPKWSGRLCCLGMAGKTLPRGLKFVYDGKIMDVAGRYDVEIKIGDGLHNPSI
jgi:hypothetical protein